MRHRGPKLGSYDVIPEILELLKERGPLRTVAIKVEMVKVSDGKGLVYREAQIAYGLSILKRRGLAINAKKGIWEVTVQGASHPKITDEEARQMSREWKTQERGPTHLVVTTRSKARYQRSWR